LFQQQVSAAQGMEGLSKEIFPWICRTELKLLLVRNA
jgi:hypothetical protein